LNTGNGKKFTRLFAAGKRTRMFLSATEESEGLQQTFFQTPLKAAFM